MRDESYSPTLMRTMYRAYRVSFYRYFFGVLYSAGIGLIVAAGLVRLAG